MMTRLIVWILEAAMRISGLTSFIYNVKFTGPVYIDNGNRTLLLDKCEFRGDGEKSGFNIM